MTSCTSCDPDSFTALYLMCTITRSKFKVGWRQCREDHTSGNLLFHSLSDQQPWRDVSLTESETWFKFTHHTQACMVFWHPSVLVMEYKEVCTSTGDLKQLN